jgi:hypothetical protein
MKHIATSIALSWRPKLFLALAFGAAGALYDGGQAIATEASQTVDLLTPRQMFARGLLIVTVIEALWWVGRNAYDAYHRTGDEVLSEVGATLLEMLMLYAGYLSVLAVTTVMAGMLQQTAFSTFAEMLNLAFWAGIALVQLTRITIHWKGSEDAARRFFDRIGSAWTSAKGGEVDAALSEVQKEASQ